MGASERREFNRFAADTTARLVRLRDGRRLSAVIKDLSRAGAGFTCGHPLELHERVVLILPLVRRRHKLLLSEVQYSRETFAGRWHIGVSFLEQMESATSAYVIPLEWKIRLKMVSAEALERGRRACERGAAGAWSAPR